MENLCFYVCLTHFKLCFHVVLGCLCARGQVLVFFFSINVCVLGGSVSFFFAGGMLFCSFVCRLYAFVLEFCVFFALLALSRPFVAMVLEQFWVCYFCSLCVRRRY